MALNVLIYVTFLEILLCIFWGMCAVKFAVVWPASIVAASAVVYAYNDMFPFIPELPNVDNKIFYGSEIVDVSTMNAAIYTPQFGPDLDITFDDAVKIPNHNNKQVLIKFQAGGINPVDYRLNYATIPFLRYFKKYIAGKDFTGVVVSVGQDPSCKHLSVGKEVFGFTMHGSFAEYFVAKCGEAVARPEKLSIAQAGSISLVAATAIHNFDLVPGGIKDKNILIIGGSGGCGLSALHYVKSLQNKGSRLVSINSEKNNEIVTKLGAKEVVNYNRQALFDEWVSNPANENQFDVVYAAINTFEYFDVLMPVLKQGATWLFVDGEQKSYWTIVKSQISYFNPKGVHFTTKLNTPDRKTLERVRLSFNEIESVVVQSEIPLNSNFSVWSGFNQVKSRRAVGKVVFTL